jgi:hypothetical protein
MSELTLTPEQSAGWEAGVNVGVPGGIDQYLPGSGHVNERPNSGPKFIDVTLPPYNVANNDNTTTGTISNSSATLTVADSTGFEIGNRITITGAGTKSVFRIIVNSGPSSSGDISIGLDGAGGVQLVAVTSGQTATQVAEAIAAFSFTGYTNTQDGTAVYFSATSAGFKNQMTFSGGTTGVTASTIRTVTGSTPHSTGITAKDGNTLTVSPVPDIGGTDLLVSQNASHGINLAIAAVASGGVVYLPAGVYHGGFDGIHKDNYTVRGAGPTTIIRPTGSSGAINVGGAYDYNWAVPNRLITEDLFKGQSVIPLSDTSEFAAGNLVHISILNSTDPNQPVVSTAAFERVRKMMSRVVSKTVDSITIFPALYYDHPAILEPRISRATNVAEFVGVEDLAVDMNYSNSSLPIRITQSYASWFKGVHVYDVTNRHIEMSYNVQFEMRLCDLRTRRGSGTNGAGLLFGRNSGCLIEDNIITEISSLIQINDGSAGNVFAYNFLYDSRLTGVNGPGLKTNHGPHNSFNLFEGNVSPNTQNDGYFGSGSEDVHFRNWYHGTNPTISGSVAIILNRFTRNNVLIANILGWDGVQTGVYSFGNPNLGNGAWTGTAMPSGWVSALTTRTSATEGTATASVYPAWENTAISPFHSITTGQVVDIWWNGGERTGVTVGTVSGNLIPFSGGTGPDLPVEDEEIFIRDWWADWPARSGSFQEQDLDVEQSTIRKDNYIALASGTGAIRASEVSSITHDPSLFRSSKPVWFGELPWPPFSSSSPVFSFESIPAGYRYVNEEPVEPDLPTVSTPVFSPNGGSHDEPFSFTITSGTSGASIYWTDDGSDPTELSTLYDGAITPPLGSTLYKARAYADDMNESIVRSATFVISEFEEPPPPPGSGIITLSGAFNVVTVNFP